MMNTLVLLIVSVSALNQLDVRGIGKHKFEASHGNLVKYILEPVQYMLFYDAAYLKDSNGEVLATGQRYKGPLGGKYKMKDCNGNSIGMLEKDDPPCVFIKSFEAYLGQGRLNCDASAAMFNTKDILFECKDEQKQMHYQVKRIDKGYSIIYQNMSPEQALLIFWAGEVKRLF